MSSYVSGPDPVSQMSTALHSIASSFSAQRASIEINRRKDRNCLPERECFPDTQSVNNEPAHESELEPAFTRKASSQRHSISEHVVLQHSSFKRSVSCTAFIRTLLSPAYIHTFNSQRAKFTTDRALDTRDDSRAWGSLETLKSDDMYVIGQVFFSKVVVVFFSIIRIGRVQLELRLGYR